MKITLLGNSGRIYSCNAYFISGDWNTLDDINTMIDVGKDAAVFESLESAPAGVGQNRVSQILVTHFHYDHVELLAEFKKRYNPKVMGYCPTREGVDRHLRGGEILRCGDREFEVIHMPGHSSDSLCYYCERDGALFSGDVPLAINSPGGSYEAEYVRCLEDLCRRDVQAVYPGHGAPMLSGCAERLKRTLTNVLAGRIA